MAPTTLLKIFGLLGCGCIAVIALPPHGTRAVAAESAPAAATATTTRQTTIAPLPEAPRLTVSAIPHASYDIGQAAMMLDLQITNHDSRTVSGSTEGSSLRLDARYGLAVRSAVKCIPQPFSGTEAMFAAQFGPTVVRASSAPSDQTTHDHPIQYFENLGSDGRFRMSFTLAAGESLYVTNAVMANCDYAFLRAGQYAARGTLEFDSDDRRGPDLSGDSTLFYDTPPTVITIRGAPANPANLTIGLQASRDNRPGSPAFADLVVSNPRDVAVHGYVRAVHIEAKDDKGATVEHGICPLTVEQTGFLPKPTPAPSPTLHRRAVVYTEPHDVTRFAFPLDRHSTVVLEHAIALSCDFPSMRPKHRYRLEAEVEYVWDRSPPSTSINDESVLDVFTPQATIVR